MAKAEISWKGRTEEGFKREVYARRVGDQWKFFVRSRRYECWEALADPPVEDWLELLDGIRRRIQRRLLRPEEEIRVKKTILERYPGTQL